MLTTECLMTEAQKQRVIDNYNLIHYVLKKYKNQIDKNYEEYEQVAAFALCLAAMRFDKDKGFTFATYAVPYINGFVKNHQEKNMFPIKLSRKAFYSREAEKIVFTSLNFQIFDEDGHHELGEFISSEENIEDNAIFEADLFNLLRKKLKPQELKHLTLYLKGYKQQEIAIITKSTQPVVSKGILKAKRTIRKYIEGN